MDIDGEANEKILGAFSRFAADAGKRDVQLARLEERLAGILNALHQGQEIAEGLVKRLEEESRATTVLGMKLDEVRGIAQANIGRMTALEARFEEHLRHSQEQVSRLDGLHRDVALAAESVRDMRAALDSATTSLLRFEGVSERFEAKEKQRKTLWEAFLAEGAKMPVIVLTTLLGAILLSLVLQHIQFHP
jgi:chromosome segregation ATPase